MSDSPASAYRKCPPLAAGFFVRGRMGGMTVLLGTPEDQPHRTIYICPGCSTPIPFGTDTTAPPANCPTCKRRLYIPSVLTLAELYRRRDKQKATTNQPTVRQASTNDVKPMRYRKLRIAWSVGWGLAAVLLIVLWVRSYWWHERVIWSLGGNDVVQAGHVLGQVRISKWQTAAPPLKAELARVRLSIEQWRTTHRNRADGSSIDFPRSAIGLGGESTSTHLLLYLPYWFLFGMACFSTASPWLRLRFSVRTLLIATTLVAVVLGLIVWAAKN